MLDEFVRSIKNGELARYVSVGLSSTLVNLLLFGVLANRLRLNITFSNVVSISAATIVAYIGNKKIVFRSKCMSIAALMKEFWGFVGSRIATMIMELVGVFLLVTVLGMGNMAGKFITVVAVGICNYLVTKLIVFAKPSKKVSGNPDTVKEVV